MIASATSRVPCPTLTVQPTCGPADDGSGARYALTVSGTGYGPPPARPRYTPPRSPTRTARRYLPVHIELDGAEVPGSPGDPERRRHFSVLVTPGAGRRPARTRPRLPDDGGRRHAAIAGDRERARRDDARSPFRRARTTPTTPTTPTTTPTTADDGADDGADDARPPTPRRRRRRRRRRRSHDDADATPTTPVTVAISPDLPRAVGERQRAACR